jgi:hypothetical protein
MKIDELIKIAQKLDEENHYELADKIDKIAQKAQRDIYDFNNNPNAGETWYNRLGRIFSGNATIYDYPGLANTLRQNDKQMQFWKNKRRRNSPNRNQMQQNQLQQSIQLLVSTTPQQLAQNLLEFGRKNNLNDLAKTMDLYSGQGGTFMGQPINQNQQALKLYSQVKNYSGNLSQQQILTMLTGSGQ